MTASADEIALAWVAGPGLLGNDPVAGSAQFARFAPDLSLISQSGCFGPANAHRVALARSRAGYVVAVDDDEATGVSIQLLDATGSALGPPRILAGASYPALVERVMGDGVSGGPLLVWSETPANGSSASGLALRAELLGDDGAAETPPTTLVPVTSVGHTNGIFTGAGFFVGPEGGGVRFVALDGTVTTPPMSATTGEYPGLAWSGADGALVFFPANWQRFDASGLAVGAPVTLPKSVFIPSAISTQGSDAIVVFGTGTGTIDLDHELSVGRFAVDATTVTAPFRVVADPQGLAEPRLARSGTETVLAWVGGVGSYPGRIGLAMLAP